MSRFLIFTVLASTVCIVALQLGLFQRNQLPFELSEVRQLEWSDLVPPADPLADALADTPMNVRFDLGFIRKVFDDADAEIISRDGPEYRNAKSLLEKYRAEGVDVDTLLAAVGERDTEITRRGEAINSALDGELVRLPGYALPLQVVEGGVTEFLLVPFVGACIHVPPPPPNQIVLAELASEYQVNSLFDPVMITGQLKAKSASTELYLVDGQAQVPMGYSMDVMHVEPMEE